jgi:hypothetical protein
MPTIYGDDPAPPRYFLREDREPEESERTECHDWRQFVLIVMRALLPFPEARVAVVAAFGEAGANASP